MSVSQVANSGAGQSGWNTQIREVRREFHQLFKAVRSGDQVEQQAQATTAALQQLGSAQTVSSSGDSSSVGERTVGSVNSDIGALRQALRSGDSTAAQNLLTQLEQDVRSISLAPAHGSRHHHFGGMAPQSPSYPETPAAPVDEGGDTSVPATTTDEPQIGTTDETAAATPTETVPVPTEAATPPVAETPAAPATGEVVAAVPSGESVAIAPSGEVVPATQDATVAVGTVPADPLAAIISSIQQPEPVVIPDPPVIDTTA